MSITILYTKTTKRVHMFYYENLILLAYFFRVCLCVEAELGADFDGAAPYFVEVNEEPAIPNESLNGVLNATLFKTIKYYYCRSRTQDNVDEELLLFGTKAWTFPSQDVNLTLRYPSKNQEDAGALDRVDYVLTSLIVVFHLSGTDSKGYITSGGMHQDHINTVFVFRNITSLSYQLFLHGVPSSLLNVTENSRSRVDLC